MPKKPPVHRPGPHDIFLGVDGGGTKTQAVIVDSRGRVISSDTGGPSNPLRVGIETAASNIVKTAAAACDKAGRSASDTVFAVAGIAGVRRSDLRENLERRLKESLSYTGFHVCVDTRIALEAAVGDGPGIVIIAGTGSVCFGRNEQGETAMAGGWGPLAGDEGGAVFIALRALQAVAKAADGRGAETELSGLAARYFRASRPEDLIVALYSPQMDFKRIAGFAKDVSAAAASGDVAAREIFAEAAAELAVSARAVIERLGMGDSEVTVGLSGSVFKAGKLISAPLSDSLRAYAPRSKLIPLKRSAAESAAILALEMFKGERSLEK